jgi:sulfur-oxidizing protein SoxA
MKKIALSLLAFGCAIGTAGVNASPEQDRVQMAAHYKKTIPAVKPGDYIYGALAMEKDSMAQYESIMDFPPYQAVIDHGKEIWDKPFKNGKTFSSCFPNEGKNVAGNYPMFDDKMGKVVTYEMAINQCLVSNGEKEFKHGDKNTMSMLSAYSRTLSDGMKMNIKVDGTGALAAYEAGKEHFFRRRGQLNFACASCHIDNAGNRIRSETLSMAMGQATHWPVFRGGDNLVTLQTRFEGCNKQVRAVSFPNGSEEYNNLEYFLSYMSNGLPMKASVFRK